MKAPRSPPSGGLPNLKIYCNALDELRSIKGRIQSCLAVTPSNIRPRLTIKIGPADEAFNRAYCRLAALATCG